MSNVREAWEAFDEFIATAAAAEGTTVESFGANNGGRCPSCGHASWVRHDRECESVCTRCGWVDDSDVFPEVPHGDQRHRYSAPYSQVYHFNEVMAAWLNVGPVVPDADMERIRYYVATTTVSSFSSSSFTPNQRSVTKLSSYVLDRPHIRQVCNTLKMRKYAERWVQIKKRLYPDWQVVYPRPSELHRLRCEFALVARAFNRTLYKQGKKRTVRDNLWHSPHNLARHNMPHYSWLIQNLLFRIGGQELLDKVSANTFFPIQRTPAVRRRLRRMWAVICLALDWPIVLL